MIGFRARMAWIVLAIPVAGLALNAAATEPPPVTLRHLGPEVAPPVPSLHPDVELLDASARSAPARGTPLSLRATCGACHDVGHIESHHYHALAGMDEMVPPGLAPSGRAWDTGPGMFGRFDPFLGRALTPPDEEPIDLGTADWIRVLGPLHVGGGPAERSSLSGTRLDRIGGGGAGWDAAVLDETSGGRAVWDWSRSGTVELNCLLCHVRQPDNAERILALQRGEFSWASTATLAGMGLVARGATGYVWTTTPDEASGRVSARRLGLGHARSDNCRQCHGRACRCTDPVVFESGRDNWRAESGGSVFSPGRMNRSGMNLAGKEALDSPWDVHAERLLSCTHCHHAPNNPAYARGDPAAPAVRHLRFDPRRARESEYLYRPDHNFTKGDTAQGTAGRRFAGTMRGCRDCHDAESSHAFLPFARRHFAALDCNACHVPVVYPPTRRSTDWTMLDERKEPLRRHAGVDGDPNDPLSLLTGRVPALLPRRTADGATRLGPHLLHVAYFWVGGDPPRPVRRFDLERAFFADGRHHPELQAALDRNGDGTLTADELLLDTPERAEAAAARLRAVGVASPRIVGEIQPFSVSHGVGRPEGAQRDCGACHAPGGRLCQPQELAEYAPGGVMPSPVADSGVLLPGPVEPASTGIRLRPERCPAGFYVMGAQPLHALDWLGLLVLAGTVVGVVVHGSLRLRFGWRRRRSGGSA